jgi:CDP-glycerol glycerophosphotransferase
MWAERSPVCETSRVPVLSLIVPVYGVDQYLRECLDSIFAQAGAGGWARDEIEVVAVNDRSPDSSSQILADYAAREPRLRVVNHDDNLGLGASRNTGLDHATGEYVWFVDSDDWLNPGALAAVIDHLTATKPDVLIVGFERRYDDGRAVVERLIPGPPLPDTFTVREHPRVLKTLQIACNKVLRRDFLLGTGVRFADGWYEDVSFIQPVMLAAERLSVLPRSCYAYRQRPYGAITRTMNERHNEVFDQWHRTMSWVQSHQPDLVPIMFERMISHYLGVLNHPLRIHYAQRRDFFARVVRDYRTYKPAGGFPNRGMLARIRFTLVALNTFWLFEVLRSVYRSRRIITAAGREGRRLADRVFYRWQRTRPLLDQVTIYADESFQGYAATPHARTVASVLQEAHTVNSGLREVLVVDDPRVAFFAGRPDDAPPCYPTGSRGALHAFARSRLLESNGELPAGVLIRKGQQLRYLSAGPAAPMSIGRGETAPDSPTHVA